MVEEMTLNREHGRRRLGEIFGSSGIFHGRIDQSLTEVTTSKVLLEKFVVRYEQIGQEKMTYCVALQ